MGFCNPNGEIIYRLIKHDLLRVWIGYPKLFKE